MVVENATESKCQWGTKTKLKSKECEEFQQAVVMRLVFVVNPQIEGYILEPLN